jgi:predicted lipoprotein
VIRNIVRVDGRLVKSRRVAHIELMVLSGSGRWSAARSQGGPADRMLGTASEDAVPASKA